MESYVVYPTKKHNRPAPPANIYIHGFDRIGGPIDIRNNRVFHRPPSNISFEDVVENLKSSLAEALELYPPAAGLVKTDEHGKVHIAIDPQNYSGTPFLVDVKETPFVTDSADLLPRTEMVLAPGTSTVAVKVTQFSCGSIAVAASIHHQVTDLRGFLDFLEVWAQINRGEQVDYSRIPDEFTHTPNRFFSGLMENAKAGPITTAPPGFILHDKPPTSPLAFLLAPSEVTNWILTSKAVDRLKTDAAASTKKDQWISSGDAIAALIWGAATRARAKAQVERINPDSPTDSIISAADGRERDPHGEMSKGKYFGNFNPLFLSKASHSDLLDEGENGGGTTRVAQQIRLAVKEQLSPEALAAKLAFFENPQNLEPPGRITFIADFIMTNWCRNDLKGPKLDFGWGEAFYASPGAGTVYPPGYALLTQDKTTGKTHVLLTVEVPAAEDLKNDPLMNKYATLVPLKK